MGTVLAQNRTSLTPTVCAARDRPRPPSLPNGPTPACPAAPEPEFPGSTPDPCGQHARHAHSGTIYNIATLTSKTLIHTRTLHRTAEGAPPSPRACVLEGVPSPRTPLQSPTPTIKGRHRCAYAWRWACQERKTTTPCSCPNPHAHGACTIYMCAPGAARGVSHCSNRRRRTLRWRMDRSKAPSALLRCRRPGNSALHSVMAHALSIAPAPTACSGLRPAAKQPG